MAGFVVVQLAVLLLVVLVVYELVVGVVLRRLFPAGGWRRHLVDCVLCVVLGLGALMSVPGRTQHMEFIKRFVADAVSESSFNGGGSGVLNWIENKITDLTLDVIVQSVRVERHLGIFSIGYIETEAGWSPISFGCFGFVCHSFLIDVTKYETPKVHVEAAGSIAGDEQIDVRNYGAESYECAVVSEDGKTVLTDFELDANTRVRIRETKGGFKNAVKRLVNTDKSLVMMPCPLRSGMCISFKLKGQKQKRMSIGLQWIDGNFSTSLEYPR